MATGSRPCPARVSSRCCACTARSFCGGDRHPARPIPIRPYGDDPRDPPFQLLNEGGPGAGALDQNAPCVPFWRGSARLFSVRGNRRAAAIRRRDTKASCMSRSRSCRPTSRSLGRPCWPCPSFAASSSSPIRAAVPCSARSSRVCAAWGARPRQPELSTLKLVPPCFIQLSFNVRSVASF